VIHVSPDDLDGLTLEEKAALLSGRDFWSTKPVDGLPAVVLTDGPHGVRRQAGDFDALGIFENLPATCFPPAVAVGSSWDPPNASRRRSPSRPARSGCTSSSGRA
jgi:beta-glucosidase